MTFWVRQKVVCIDSGGNGWNASLWTLPVKDNIYTVREVFIIRGFEFIRLMEIVNPPMADIVTGKTFEPRFLAFRFRPIVEPKAEVSFTQGADPSTDQFDNRRKVRKKVVI